MTSVFSPWELVMRQFKTEVQWLELIIEEHEVV
jgi:hypothetical protein